MLTALTFLFFLLTSLGNLIDGIFLSKKGKLINVAYISKTMKSNLPATAAAAAELNWKLINLFRIARIADLSSFQPLYLAQSESPIPLSICTIPATRPRPRPLLRYI